MIEHISFEDGNLRQGDLLHRVRQQLHTKSKDNAEVGVLDAHSLSLDNIPPRNITHVGQSNRNLRRFKRSRQSLKRPESVRLHNNPAQILLDSDLLNFRENL